MKRILIGFAACGLTLLVLGAAATRNRYVGTFVGDGTGVTNAVSASGVATYVTTATLTNKTYSSNLVGAVTVTTTNTLTSLTVQAGVGTDGIVGAIRMAADQSNDVFQVQTVLNDMLFGVNTNGAMKGAGILLVTNPVAKWPATPDFGGAAYFANSNGTVYLLTSLPLTKTWAATNKLAP